MVRLVADFSADDVSQIKSAVSDRIRVGRQISSKQIIIQSLKPDYSNFCGLKSKVWLTIKIFSSLSSL
jgi:hypothetical protein